MNQTDFDIETIISALNLYSSFFIVLIIFSFISFIAVLLILIRNIKSRKSLKENRIFLSETIQVQEEERKRISQELHDTVSQNIKALVLMEKECIELAEKADGAALKTALQKVLETEKQNQKDLRKIIQNLVIPPLENSPLKNVIKDTCLLFSEQTGVPCKVFISKDAEEPLDVFNIEEKHHIIRIIQEALNNAAIHSGCSETSVVIRKEEKGTSAGTPQSLSLMIFDDGKGISQEGGTYGSVGTGTIPTHFGMTGMEMRAHLLGGTFTIKSTPETGTEVRVEIERD